MANAKMLEVFTVHDEGVVSSLRQPDSGPAPGEVFSRRQVRKVQGPRVQLDRKKPDLCLY